MNTEQFCIAATLASLIVTTGAKARGAPLALADAIAEARKSSTELAVAKARVAVARAGYASANKLIVTNPTLSGGFATAAPFGGGTEEYSWSFGLSQTIEIGGQQVVRKDIVSAEAAAADGDERRIRNELLADVVVTFYALDEAQRIAALQRDVKTIYDDLLAASRKLLDKGAGTKLDVLSLEIELARVNADTAAAVGLARSLDAQLAGLLGRTGDASFEPITPDTPSIDPDPSVDALLKKALETRPEIAAARARVRWHRSVSTLAKREVWLSPTVGIGVQYDRTFFGTESFRLAPGGVPGLLGIDERRTALTLNLSIPIPIFDPRSRDVARAHAQADAASVEEQAAKVKVEADVRSALAAWKGARDAFASYEKVRPSMDEAAQSYREAFAKGGAALAETLLGEERVIRARLQRLGARTNYLRARALLDKAVGTWSL